MSPRRVNFADLVEIVEEMRDDMRDVKVAIAGDPVVGLPGLQARVYKLERETGGRGLYRAMVALAAIIGSAIGAATGSITGRQ